ncbi:hypothetical protein OCU04_002552 [Sclerotinia nivalis]|uniref:Uncharacterized protein n=1 Tax=Sclerotinia nivalis TaxID=352851 RepID=A0A9X0DQB3_9HELO|nr:hypothetical protein OCU04_002552 [Sclerotinia nivalis]
MAPIPVSRAGAALVAAAAISSSFSSSSSSDSPTTPIIASTVTSILQKCSLTSLSDITDKNAARKLHCLAELSESAIDKAYARAFFAQPFTSKAIFSIVLIILFGLMALMALMGLLSVGESVVTCCGERRSKEQTKG